MSATSGRCWCVQGSNSADRRMTVLDVLGELLERADAPDEEADHFLVDDLGEYPEEHLAALATIGILVPGTPARTILCPACSDEHWEEPEPMPGAHAPGFIRCGRYGPQAIEPAQLERRRIDFFGLANHLAALLEEGRSSAPLIPGRLWRLGEVMVGSASGDVYLMRGVTWNDGPQLLEPYSLRGVLLCPQLLAPKSPGADLRIMAVTDVLHITSSGHLGLRTERFLQSNISYEAVEEAHELSGGRPPIPGDVWKMLSEQERVILEQFPASSALISNHLATRGYKWNPNTVTSERTRLRKRLEEQGLGAALPDGRPNSSGRTRPFPR